MRLLVQKLPIEENISFVAKTFRTPDFEVGWHQHIEYEMILFTEGLGLSFIGNHVGDFETGDIYFLGSNVPHTFQKQHADLVTSAIVVQFVEDFWGNDFINLPESRGIRQLFATSAAGLKITGQTRRQLQPLIRELENAKDFKRIIILCECLQLIAQNKEFTKVSTQSIKHVNLKGQEPIDKVFQFTIDSFREPVSLAQVAAIACMSIPAFCNYFKTSTKKTYIDFLNEIRIGYACNLLVETRRPVLDICYDSGYNTMTNFHKQFLKIKKKSPLQFRKIFSADIINRGTNIGIIESA